MFPTALPISSKQSFKPLLVPLWALDLRAIAQPLEHSLRAPRHTQARFHAPPFAARYQDDVPDLSKRRRCRDLTNDKDSSRMPETHFRQVSDFEEALVAGVFKGEPNRKHSCVGPGSHLFETYMVNMRSQEAQNNQVSTSCAKGAGIIKQMQARVSSELGLQLPSPGNMCHSDPPERATTFSPGTQLA